MHKLYEVIGMMNISMQFFGGRGSSGGKRAGGGGGSAGGSANYGKNPDRAPIGTRLSMGGYTYRKTGSNTWMTYGPSGKRVKNRTNADIKRVYT